MKLFLFFRDALAWSMLVTALGGVLAFLGIFLPAQYTWGGLAYKIRHGPKPLSEEQEDELGTRAFWGAFTLALLTAAFILLDYILAAWLDFPAGIAHLVVFVAYAAAATWLCTFLFGFSDLLDGLGIFVIYVFLPALVLWLLNLVTGLFEKPLSFVYDWLPLPTGFLPEPLKTKGPTP